MCTVEATNETEIITKDIARMRAILQRKITAHEEDQTQFAKISAVEKRNLLESLTRKWCSIAQQGINALCDEIQSKMPSSIDHLNEQCWTLRAKLIQELGIDPALIRYDIDEDIFVEDA